MTILAVDDEALQLDKLTEAIRTVLPDADITAVRKPSQALSYAEDREYDLAFLDVQMRGMTGVELAAVIQRMYPRINIVFVTAYNDYKADAMDLRASGYITKPVTPEKIKAEIENLRFPIAPTAAPANKTAPADSEEVSAEEPARDAMLTIQCFGSFDVFDREHRPLRFTRFKAKELLAYLVSRRGSRCTGREICAAIYEDVEYTSRVQDSFRHVSSALVQALREVGAEEVLLKDHQNYAIDISKVDCDYYNFMQEDPLARKKYTGEFMSQYSWAEYINAYLDSQV